MQYSQSEYINMEKERLLKQLISRCRECEYIDDLLEEFRLMCEICNDCVIDSYLNLTKTTGHFKYLSLMTFMFVTFFWCFS